MTEKVQISQFLCLHFYPSESRRAFRLCHVCRLWLCHTELADAMSARMSFGVLWDMPKDFSTRLEIPHLGFAMSLPLEYPEEFQCLENLEPFSPKVVNNSSDRLSPVFI